MRLRNYLAVLAVVAMAACTKAPLTSEAIQQIDERLQKIEA